MLRDEIKPTWTTSSFLIYAGGLTVLGGALSGLAYLATQAGGNFARAAWAFLFLVILYGLAVALRLRESWLAAGILAFVSMFVWAIFLVFLFMWFGWSSVTASIGDWSFPKMVLWILVLVAASFDRMFFRFPFIRFFSVLVFYLLVVDLFTSGQGNWFAFVTLFTGFIYLLLGTAIGTPSTFWLHLFGGAFIGGALLSWFHTSNFDFALISIFSVAFVLVAYATKRSSWAFYATIGFFAATIHYVVGSPTALNPFALNSVCSSGPLGPLGRLTTCHPSISPWAPALALGLLGFWLMLLGMLGTFDRRKRGHTHAAVVVPPPVPAVE